MMICYIEKFFFPNMERAREEDNPPSSQRVMCIFDVYAGHKGRTLLDLLDRKSIIVVFVSTACTNRLQSNALIPNNFYIDHSIFYTVVSPINISTCVCNEKKVQLELTFVSTTKY